MTEPTDPTRAYVRAALLVQGYDFSEERIAEIARQFARIESIAATLEPGAGSEGGEDPGTAPVFRP